MNKLTPEQATVMANGLSQIGEGVRAALNDTLATLKEAFPELRWVLAIEFSDKGGQGVLASGVKTAAAEAELLERAIEFLDSLPPAGVPS